MTLYAPNPLAVISHGLYSNVAAAVQTSKPGTWSLADSSDGQTWTLTVAGTWADATEFLLLDTDTMDGSGASVLKGNMRCKGLMVGHNYSLQATEVGKTLSDTADTQHTAPTIVANYSAGAANMRAGTGNRVDGGVTAGTIPQSNIEVASGGTLDLAAAEAAAFASGEAAGEANNSFTGDAGDIVAPEVLTLHGDEIDGTAVLAGTKSDKPDGTGCSFADTGDGQTWTFTPDVAGIDGTTWEIFDWSALAYVAAAIKSRGYRVKGLRSGGRYYITRTDPGKLRSDPSDDLVVAPSIVANHSAGAANIVIPAADRVDGTITTGTNPGGGGTPPDAPLSIGATAGNGQVVVAVAQAHAGDVIQVRYKLKTSASWVAANVAHKRTGSGNVTISGLVNESLYDFMAYTLAGALESEWIGPASCAPTAGAAGAYTKFLADLYAAISASTTLAAACTDGLPALHAKRGRFLHADAATLADLLTFGPVVYCRYVPYQIGPMTRESSKGQFVAELTIVQKFDQTVSDDLTAPSNFVEKLKQEIMAAQDGSGTNWSDRAFAVQTSIGEPQVIAKDTVSHVVKIGVGYTEAI